MNKKMKRMMQEIQRRGGIVYVNENLPEDLAERFLEEVLDCPACEDDTCGNSLFGGPPIDWIYAGSHPANTSNRRERRRADR
ncbi:MAG TPA: hypothetical protein VF618_00895 [Thermoanaerobaculia bacterium]